MSDRTSWLARLQENVRCPSAGLYPPQYRESSGAAGDSVTVVLISDPRPPLWDLVSDWIDRNGPIGNAVVCRLGDLDTVKASRMLKRWTDLGLLRALEGRGRRNRAYGKFFGSRRNAMLVFNAE